MERSSRYCNGCSCRGWSNSAYTVDAGGAFLSVSTLAHETDFCQTLQTAKAERERIIAEVDKKDGADSDDDLDDVNTRTKLLGPSLEAQAKLTDYRKLAAIEGISGFDDFLF